MACGESDSSSTQRTNAGVGSRPRHRAPAVFKVRVVHFQQVADFTSSIPTFSDRLCTHVGGADDGELCPSTGSQTQCALSSVLQDISLFQVCTRGTTMWLPLIRRMPYGEGRRMPSSKNCFTHGPVAFTVPRAFQRKLAAVDVFRFHNPQAVLRRDGVRVRSHPPPSSTICALASTRRVSSTQQSEYSKPRTISGLRTDSEPKRKTG